MVLSRFPKDQYATGAMQYFVYVLEAGGVASILPIPGAHCGGMLVILTASIAGLKRITV